MAALYKVSDSQTILEKALIKLPHCLKKIFYSSMTQSNTCSHEVTPVYGMKYIKKYYYNAHSNKFINRPTAQFITVRVFVVITSKVVVSRNGFLSVTKSRPALAPTQPSLQSVPVGDSYFRR